MFLEREMGRARTLIPADPKIYTHLPYVMELNDEIVRTRENGLMLSLEVTGVDGVTSGTAAITALRAGFAHLLDTLDSRFTFYLHRMMRPAETGFKPLHGPGFAAEIDRAWGRGLARKGLQESVLILTLVHRPDAGLPVPFFATAAARVWGEDTARRCEELHEVAAILETGLGVTTRRLRISDGSLLGFYASLLTGALRALPRSPFCLLAEDAAAATIRFGRGQFTLEEGRESPQTGAILYVKSYATATWPGMLDALGSSPDTIVTHSYTPIPRDSIAERVKRRVAQMRANPAIGRPNPPTATRLFSASPAAARRRRWPSSPRRHSAQGAAPSSSTRKRA